MRVRIWEASARCHCNRSGVKVASQPVMCGSGGQLVASESVPAAVSVTASGTTWKSWASRAGKRTRASVAAWGLLTTGSPVAAASAASVASSLSPSSRAASSSRPERGRAAMAWTCAGVNRSARAAGRASVAAMATSGLRLRGRNVRGDKRRINRLAHRVALWTGLEAPVGVDVVRRRVGQDIGPEKEDQVGAVVGPLAGAERVAEEGYRTQAAGGLALARALQAAEHDDLAAAHADKGLGIAF